MTNVSAGSYRAFGDVPLAIITPMLTGHISPMTATAPQTTAAASPHSALFWAQAWVENQWETTGHIISSSDHNPVSLRPWNEDPRGMPKGATGVITASDGGQFLRFASDADCVREWKRRIIDDPNYKGGVYRNAVTLDQMLNVYAPPGDLHPVTGVDNADIGYADIVRTMLAKFAALEDTTPPQEDTTVVTTPTAQTYSNDVAGLEGGPLVTDYKITQKLIPDWNTLQNPGIVLSWPYGSCQHGTGNPNSTAASEARWLVDQRADGAQTSVHFFAGDIAGDEVYQTLRADRVGWHAADGGGPGNMNTVAVECIESDAVWSSPTRAARVIYICADLEGRIAARKGSRSDGKPSYHWTYNYQLPANERHPCPNKILFGNPEYKAAYEKQWYASCHDEAARMKNGGVVEVVGGVIDNILNPPFDWSKAAKPYPVPALSSTDVNKGDTAPGVISKDGTDFVFVSDVVEATADLPRLQYADKSAPHTGPDIKTGERFVGAWLFKAGDGSFYYLSSAPFWSRIPAKNTKRVSDAPLKGTA
ncbi:MAG: N-acetylmuramoyl-L-alanine amidase [Thermomicrobiales bacterium]